MSGDSQQAGSERDAHRGAYELELAIDALTLIRDDAGSEIGGGIPGVKDGSWCAGVAMGALAAIEEQRALGDCFWHPGVPFGMGLALCDDDGIVRSGRFHKGTDYACTGGAHFAGEHIRCTSPAHAEATRD